MSDVERVLSWFATGRLVRPDASIPGSVHLALALASLCGANVTLDEPSRRVATAIGDSEHLVFVLADGLGMNLVDALPEGSFLRRQLALELRSVFPSSTAPALTSLATGLWPAEHGLPGWFVYLPERRVHTVSLPFIERFAKQPLQDLGLTGEDLFTHPVLMPRYKRDALSLMPASISDSAYTRYVNGGRTVVSCADLPAAADCAIERVRTAAGPTFTYIYHPAVDKAEHDHGATSAQAWSKVLALQTQLSRLADGLSGRGRVVVSADHGQLDWLDSQKLYLPPKDDLAQMLLTPPAGEPMTPTFHVQPGRAAEFAAAFRRAYGDHFALLTPDEIESLRLMGPQRLSPVTRSRLGDFVGLASEGEGLIYSPETAYRFMRGNHGGLGPDEVRIPLIVA